MLNSVHLYMRYLEVSVRGQMQYRASFVMLSIGHLLATGVEFVAILVLFARFDNLQGWTLHEVAFLYGMVNVSFSIADAAARGFDLFGNMVKSGEFDRLLTRPRSTALQLAGQELTLRRVGRFAQGFAVMAWASVRDGRKLVRDRRRAPDRNRRRRSVHLHRPGRAAGNPRILDNGDTGDHEHRHLRRR